MNILELKNIVKDYGKGEGLVTALRNVNLSINKGEMIAIMGPSGSGKSTLLNILGFLDKPTSGEYLFEGENVKNFKENHLAKYRNEKIGFVVQNFALIDDYTVYQNINIPLDYGKIKKSEREVRIKKIVEKVGLSEKINKLPKELSGGQNQRVAIARALINNPEIILADEPTGALDLNTGEEIMSIFKDLNKEGKTIIIITHDKNIANKCNRIINIKDGIVYEGDVL
ncbi:MAG: ABC transporter ATP-binding protein [Clostridiales bacterium]|nr:ABC transporter ATP-binding protein [Clostridiales bacterium]